MLGTIPFMLHLCQIINSYFIHTQRFKNKNNFFFEGKSHLGVNLNNYLNYWLITVTENIIRTFKIISLHFIRWTLILLTINLIYSIWLIGFYLCRTWWLVETVSADDVEGLSRDQRALRPISIAIGRSVTAGSLPQR